MNRGTVMFRTALFAALLSAAAHAESAAPYTVITTDSVDLFSAKQTPRVSNAFALASSIVLPGSGHQYLERNRSALVYLTAEATWFFAYFFCNHYAKKTAVAAAAYAWIHAGAQGTIASANDHYWRLVGDYLDVQEYNSVMELNRTPEKRITDESMSWHWDDKSSQRHYNALLTRSRTFGIVSSFFIGALVLDRIVAFIDTRSYLRKAGQSRVAVPSLRIQPVLTTSGPEINLSLNTVF